MLLHRHSLTRILAQAITTESFSPLNGPKQTKADQIWTKWTVLRPNLAKFDSMDLKFDLKIDNTTVSFVDGLAMVI